MKSNFVLILFSMMIFSCSEKKEEITVEDEMKATEINDTSSSKNISLIDTTFTNQDSIDFVTYQKIDSKLPFEKKVELFLEKYKLLYTEVKNDKSIIPERYENNYAKKIALKKKTTINYGKVENVYPVAQLWFYQYKDSATCRNVINNWLQCYGFDCTPVEFMVDLPAIKTTPSLAIFNEKEIIFLQYQCEHIENNWEEIRSELLEIFPQSGSYYLLSLDKCGRALKWKNYVRVDGSTVIYQ